MKLHLIPLLIAAGLAARALPAQSAADPFTPGAEHALLQELAGTWDAVLVTSGPDGLEQRTPGRLTTSTLAGFHTVDAYTGELMGLAFLGHGLNGYCTVKRQYYTLWADSMTSSPLTAYGSYDESARELRLAGECLGMSGKLEPCRLVTHLVDDDHRTFELFGAGPDGQQMRHLRIEYTRQR